LTKEHMLKQAQNDDIFKVTIRKSKLFLYVYTRDVAYEGTGSNSFDFFDITLNNIIKGDWQITDSHLHRGNKILEMQSIVGSNEFMKTIKYFITNSGHNIPYIALYQTLQDNAIKIDDANIYSNPHTVTGKGNLFIRNNPWTMKFKITNYMNTNNDVYKIAITYLSTYSTCGNDCKCVFKGVCSDKKIKIIDRNYNKIDKIKNMPQNEIVVKNNNQNLLEQTNDARNKISVKFISHANDTNDDDEIIRKPKNIIDVRNKKVAKDNSNIICKDNINEDDDEIIRKPKNIIDIRKKKVAKDNSNIICKDNIKEKFVKVIPIPHNIND
jgi:hypothetical protein